MDVTLILEKGLEKLRNIIIRKRGLIIFRLENSRGEIKNSLEKNHLIQKEKHAHEVKNHVHVGYVMKKVTMQMSALRKIIQRKMSYMLYML